MKYLNDGRKFWKTIKGFFLDKGMNFNKTMITEKDKLLSEERFIAEVMNNYFVDISKSLNLKASSESNVDNTGGYIGHSLKNVSLQDHISVKIIREKNRDNGEFGFQPISTEELKKIILGLDCNKRNLNGSIPASVLKDTCDTFIPYLTEIVNDSFQTGNFPNELKLAKVTPIYQKKDPLNNENYHPVSVLSQVPKIFEKIVYEQINSYMEPRFSHLLCGFRKNHNTPHSLLRMLEK